MTTLAPRIVATRRVNIALSNIALGVLVLVALLVHSYNMFGYPLYSGDEGIYMSQAYATARLGQITPYAYWYDHAPAGWILISLWSIFTGGFHTFGTAVDGGRVLMLLLHLAAVALLFRLSLRLTTSITVAMTAGLLFTLSPMSVQYGRMVLLDNIMVVWALLSAVLMLRHNGKIWPLLYSGIGFGMAVLTKENAILFLPAFIYGLWTLVERHHARFARAGWLFMALSFISFYFLYAALRAELIDWSFSSPLAGGAGPVTLLGALLWQMQRSGGMPWDPASDFYRMLMQWLALDPWIIGLGAFTTLWNVVRGDHSRRMVGLLSLLGIIGLAHGGVVYDFYIISLLPFLAINIGLFLEELSGLLRMPSLMPATVVAAIAIGAFQLNTHEYMFQSNVASIQRDALSWVQQHVPPEAQIVINDDLWVDLRNGANGQPSFPGAHSHWKVASDPAVYHDLFYDDWTNIDYLVVEPETKGVLAQNAGKLTNLAYANSTPIKTFSNGTQTVEIRKVNHAGPAVNETLTQSYQSFRDRFIANGQVRAAGGYTNASSQSNAMLMAVWMNDQTTFDQLWTWTRMHLQNQNGLLYRTNEPGANQATTTDADTDTALALLLAERRWNDASYGRFAQEMMSAIWDHSVVEINGAPYLAAGDWAVSDQQVIFAPSTFAPYAYHVFAEADQQHNWWYLLDTNYALLSKATFSPLNQNQSVGLPPTYVAVDRTTGEIVPNPAGLPDSSNFTDEAAQVFWRVGLDAVWHDDQRPDNFLNASRFLSSEWQNKQSLAASYAHNGTPLDGEADLAMYGAVLPKFMVSNAQIAHQLYATKLASAFTQTNGVSRWSDNGDVAQQEWAWLATGIYSNQLGYDWSQNK
ncbi:MAG TPA: glycosyl hydrolase family 8 [Roseiflexaceae bacterium]|nr:glycosyl hydrolase family 8 [Roseiflexaceae bacterium]